MANDDLICGSCKKSKPFPLEILSAVYTHYQKLRPDLCMECLAVLCDAYYDQMYTAFERGEEDKYAIFNMLGGPPEEEDEGYFNPQWRPGS